MSNVKLYVGLGLLFLLFLFAIQNAALLEVSFLFWTFTMRRALVLFLVLAVGIVFGWFLRTWVHRRRQHERQEN